MIHLAYDARKYGSLNAISCFPFESFLGHLKSVVRRSQNPISQIVRRYTEKVRANENLVAEHNSPDAALKCHRQKHNAGPLPSSHSKFDQYKKYLGKYVVSITSPNNCFEVNGSIYLVKNILLKPTEGTFVVVQKFCRNIDFFDFPLNSSRLSIWAVDLLNTGSDFDVFPVENLGCKTILLPFKDVYVAIPLLHMDHAKFQK